MYKYEDLKIKIIYWQPQDIVTSSTSDSESADDLGGWNEGWFTQNNG